MSQQWSPPESAKPLKGLALLNEGKPLLCIEAAISRET